MIGTLGGALEAREISSAENLVAEVEGDVVEGDDGVLRIAAMRVHYSFAVPEGMREKAERALATYADRCPAYVTVKEAIAITWDAEIRHE